MSTRSRTRTTKWNLFFHFSAIVLAMVSGILLVPLYLQFIPLDLYGAWLATGNILVWLTTIDPGLSTVLQQRVGVAYGRSDFEEVRGLLWAGVAISIVISLLVFMVGAMISGHFVSWLNLGPEVDDRLLEKAFWLAIAGSAITIFSFSIISINQGLQSSLGIGLVFVVVNLFGIILTVILLYNGWGVLAIPLGALWRGVGLTVGNASYLIWRVGKERIGFWPSFGQIPTVLKLTSYTFLARAGAVITNNVDSVVVARFLGVEMVPVLALTRKAPEMSRMFVERPAIAFKPAISHLVGTGEIDKAQFILLRLVRMTLWLLGFLLGGFLAFNDDFVRLWVGPDLFAGVTINLAICMTFVVAVISSGLGNLCTALGDIKNNSLAVMAQNMLYIPLIVGGVKYLGLLGVVLAPLLATTAISLWYYPYSFAKLLRLGAEERKEMGKEAVIVIGLVLLVTLGWIRLQSSGWLLFALYAASFTICYVVALSIFSGAFRAEGKIALGRIQTQLFRLMPSYNKV